MNAAHDLLQSLRDFGWPLLAYAIFAPIPTFVLPSGRPREERVTRLLFVGAILAAIEALFFIGTESSNFVQILRLHPVWGCYVVLLLLLAIGLAAKWIIRRGRENRKVINLTNDGSDSDGAPSRTFARSYIAVGGIWLIGMVVAVIWLSSIASDH